MDSFISLFDPNQSDEISSDMEQDMIDIKLDEKCTNNNHNHNQNQKNISNNDKINNNHNHYNHNHYNHSNNKNSTIIDFEQGVLPPEPQLGNIEYKLKLINPSKQRFEHLVTQMKWRLREGHGEARYEIGVSDSGHLQGLGDIDMTTSLATLKQMALKLGATTTVLQRKSILIADGHRSVAEVLVRKIPDDQHNIEIRVAVLGGENAGKSTLVGCLTEGILDNGRGSARINMFRNVHDLETGRTSCISHETLGFDSLGNVINYKYYEMITCEEISDRSSKLVTFMDLAGHRRYMRKTVQALTGYSPHHAMLMIASDKGITTTTSEHLAIVHALEMPFFIVITKIDVQSPDEILLQLKIKLSSIEYRKVSFLINNEDDVLTASTHQFSEKIVPIFCVSNVTGVGLELMTKFLYVLSPGISNAEKERLEQEPCEFQIDEIFKIGEIGPVVGGLLVKGVITENMPMKIGPLYDGKFLSVIVQSIHRNRAPCRVVRAGQSASLAFLQNKNLSMLRSGMVLLPDAVPDDISCGSLFFQARISVLYHTTAIYVGCQTTVHIGSIRQTAVIEGIMGGGKIGTNDTASVLFRFICHPEYVTAGMRILFREGISKGIGQVTQVFPVNKKFN